MERRRHRVFLTTHTEYHLRDQECVAVLDRQHQTWRVHHPALRLRALRIPPAGQEAQWIGRQIHFWGAEADVLTSSVVSVERPAIGCLPRYVSHAAAGTIHTPTGSRDTA